MMHNLFVFFLGISSAWGHGSSIYPSPWHATTDCDPSSYSKRNCRFGLQIPETGCTKGSNRCSRNAGRNAWFTNYTSVPEMTIDKEFLDSRRIRSSAGLHPWTSPGAAPTYGNGCGLNGGNPDGCDGEDDVFGRCCGGGKSGGGCGGYVGGKPAAEHYEDGLFKTPRLTTWTRGQPAEAYWASKAGHRGGYAYRLCRVNDTKYWEVTEDCFRAGHLNFYGDKQWIYAKMLDEEYSPDKWTERELITTTKGTTPEGSMWAKVDLPVPQEQVASWGFKDLLEVPEDLEAGDYVLSFRWDCEKTPQVWNSCANIRVE